MRSLSILKDSPERVYSAEAGIPAPRCSSSIEALCLLDGRGLSRSCRRLTLRCHSSGWYAERYVARSSESYAYEGVCG